ncbi:hypothetical protein F5887DRAFT_948656 [Amanita rubescens]|nr:hypothetical protein F5887DRAFT_1013978 [Amanita rubescens]KAF8348977.1 hypothetical protein F5887DRAFT_948656 [Amanita rubescens]
MLTTQLLAWFAVSTLVCAQTTTITDPNSGQTVVEVVTTDSILGVPTTSTISILVPATTPTTTTLTTTTPNNPQGPVGQPAPTTATAGAPTPFTFTTIIGGQTIVSTAIFTPTNPATTPVVPTMSGTVWALSSYLNQYGPTTAAGSASTTVKVNFAPFISAQIFMIYIFVKQLLIL